MRAARRSAIGAPSRAVQAAVIGLVRAYQVAVSPWLGAHCRHLPSCSAYARECVVRFGPWRGGALALARIARCHPWGTAGYDPVPEGGRASASEEARREP